MSSHGYERGRPAASSSEAPPVSTLKPPADRIGADVQPPALTRDQAAVIEQWIAATHDLPAQRVGFVVLVETRSGRTRRRAYLSLAGAFAAQRRAEARGTRAEVVLVELVPLRRGDQR